MPRLRLAIVANPATAHQTAAGQALAEACRRHGDEPILLRSTYDGLPSCDAVAVWGWRKGEPLRQAGREVLVMERGYIGDRFRYTSLGWNGLNGRADFRLGHEGRYDRQRFDTLFEPLLRDWKPRRNRVAVIMGQVPGDAALGGRDLGDWYLEAANAVRLRYDQVLFRPHPVAVQRGQARPGLAGLLPPIAGSLDEVLAAADLVVTWNSNSAVDALLAGVPAIACDEGSMAWPICGRGVASDAGHRVRNQWAERLAHCQWTPEEIAAGSPHGDAWGRLRNHLTQRKAA